MERLLRCVTLTAAALVSLLGLAPAVGADPGRLERSFGDDGILRATAPLTDDSTNDVVADSAGRIVALATGPDSSELLRMLPSGAPDPSFGGDGRVALAGGPWRGIALDSAGRIVVAGTSDRDLAVARYVPDGSADLSFSGDGLATLHVEVPPREPEKNPGVTDGRLDRVAVDSVGRIVALGEGRACYPSSDQSPDECFHRANVAVRFDSGGDPDQGFGNGGAVTLDVEQLTGGRDWIPGLGALALQPDGKVLVGGTTGEHMALLRLTSGGALDSSFSGDGIFTSRLDTDTGPEEMHYAGNAKAILVRGDSRLVAVGERALIGLQPGGELDLSFGEDGSAPVEPPALRYGVAIPEAAALDSKGRIIVAGRDRYDGVALRYFPNGRPDARFARGGYSRLNLTEVEFADDDEAPAESLTAVTLLADGDLLAGGFSKPGKRSPRRLTLARLDNADGRLAYCHGKLAVLQGTPGRDRLSADGPVVAFAGNDLIQGSRGDICAGPGDDVLKSVGGSIDAGAGDDRVLASYSSARVLGGPGDDELRGGRGQAPPVFFFGGGGDDLLAGATARDRLHGGAGSDRLVGKGARDRLFGGPGSDLLVGNGGTDHLLGGAGRDRLLPGPEGPPQVVYRGEQPKLKISIVVRPGHVSGLHIDVTMDCRDGYVSRSSLNWDRFRLPIRPDGSFVYRESRGWNIDHLRGRLVGNRIVGTYRSAYGTGRGRCETGTPKDPLLHFVARR